jgi:hypothetical protein
MKSNDLMNTNNNRADAIEKIQAFCHRYGYEYTYTEKEFTIKLPHAEEIPVTMPETRRRAVANNDLSFLNPDPNGYHEDELPPIDIPLNEGETPDETK